MVISIPLPGGSFQEIVFLSLAVFIEKFVDGAGEKREFFLCIIFDDLNGLPGLFRGKTFGHEPVDQFLHGR